MKNPYIRFATGVLAGVLLGLIFCCLYGKLPCALTAIFAPMNGSPWELSKLAYWPLLGMLVLLRLTAGEGGKGAAAALTTTPLALFLLLFATRSLMGRWSLALWILALAGGLYLAERIKKSTPVWRVLAAALGVAYILFSFLPPQLLPFLDPTDVASFAPILF